LVYIIIPDVLSYVKSHTPDASAVIYAFDEAQGLTNKEIAQRLVISDNTVKRHLKGIFVRLEVNTRSAAAAKAAGAGMRSA
jgi:DNA-binding NarL/FixJ family response regulator